MILMWRGSVQTGDCPPIAMSRACQQMTRVLLFLGLLAAVLCAPLIGEVAESSVRETMEHGLTTRLWWVAVLPVRRLSTALLAGTLGSVAIAAFVRARAVAMRAALAQSGRHCPLCLVSLLPPPRGSVLDSDDPSRDHFIRAFHSAFETPRLPECSWRPGGLALAGRGPPVCAIASDRPP